MGGLERNICSRSLKSGSCSWDKNTHIGKKMQAGCTVLMYFKSTLDQQFLLWAHTSLRLQKTPPEGSGHRTESITVGCLRRNTSRCWHKTLVGYFNKIIALVWLITGHIFDKSIFKNHEFSVLRNIIQSAHHLLHSGIYLVPNVWLGQYSHRLIINKWLMIPAF